jgi:hypothetical protein
MFSMVKNKNKHLHFKIKIIFLYRVGHRVCQLKALENRKNTVAQHYPITIHKVVFL